MTDFDPADPPSHSLPRFQRKARKTYERLLERGDEETAEELRQQDSPSEMARFARQEVVEFDPANDEQADNTAKIAVQNAYNALIELGYDDHAEELREFTHVGQAKEHVLFKIAPKLKEEDGVAIDPMTGEYDAPDLDETTEQTA